MPTEEVLGPIRARRRYAATHFAPADRAATVSRNPSGCCTAHLHRHSYDDASRQKVASARNPCRRAAGSPTCPPPSQKSKSGTATPLGAFTLRGSARSPVHVSVPVPPATRSLPRLPLSVSSPGPPQIRSFPAARCRSRTHRRHQRQCGDEQQRLGQLHNQGLLPKGCRWKRCRMVTRTAQPRTATWW